MSPVLAQVLDDDRDELTVDEARQYAEEQTDRYFGMSVAEFVRRAEAGQLDADNPMVVHLALLTGARIKTC